MILKELQFCPVMFAIIASGAFVSGLPFQDRKQAETLGHLNSFEVVTPVKVTATGDFLSHDVRHFCKRETRRRRSVEPDQDLVHYQLVFGGNEAFLTLHPNHKLMASGLVIEKRKGRNLRSHENRTRLTVPTEKHCLFHGSVKGVKFSHVALSTCIGLSGVIRTPEEDYFIEPLKGNQGNESGIPHIVYKRSVLLQSDQDVLKGQKMDPPTCGNDDDVTSAIRNRFQWEEEHQAKNSDSDGRSRRRKRSVSVERNVETLVVADKMMVDYYSDEDIETYILTVMNMVSTLYHDASIGNAINIVLVRMILLENEEQEEEEDLKINHHADNTLKSFCKWQKYINPKDENHPNHHDVAILLTRYNICTRVNEPCSTLGLAEVAGMCQPHRSCNVNEDTGLALAYTIAHEMGHNFGMSHDGPHNGCQAPFGERQHVMSPHLNSDASPLIWSNCSRTEITKFLDRDWGSCLDDEPSEHEFTFPELPPGAMYDADHQCRLQYGPDAGFCEGIEDVCQTLWCRQDSKCVTRLEPAAEGTLCGRNMWCYMGKCSEIGERAQAIDGEWGPWTPWSKCSRSCGAGVMVSERHCENPMPATGGRYCIGVRKRYRICNTEPCSELAPSFRAEQCSNFDDVPYKEELHTWVPVSTPMTPCQLHCKPEGKFFSVMLSDTVADGTRCNPGTRDICINGKCRHVGCDWGIESSAQEDRCGICHGDGTQCLTIRGTFDQKTGIGYVEAVVVPKGARNIKVVEVSEALNYIAVKGEDDEFYLNGQWFIQWSGEYKAAGTMLYYQRDGEKESLHAPGPIKENLKILLLYQAENPGLTYEYTIPNKNVTRKPEFHWEYTGWTVCSATCGGGIQVSRAKCLEMEAGLVEEKYCDPVKRPADATKVCNKHQCPAKWWAGPWQHCSVTCGSTGTRRRTVICVRSLGPDEQIALPDEDCDSSERPSDVEPCHHKQPCLGDAKWDAGQWSDVCKEDPCNYQSRHVYCNHPSGKCDDKTKPSSRRQCGNITCGFWMVGNWSPCSTSCGTGLKTRNVTCQGGVVCHKATQPPSTSDCYLKPCEMSVERSPETDTEKTTIFPTDPEENIIPQEGKYSKKKLIVHKHRHHHYIHDKQKSDDKVISSKKLSRPRMISKDVIPIPMYEIDDPRLFNSTPGPHPDDDEDWLINEVESEEDSIRKIRKEPAVIPYVFEEDEPVPEPDGHKYDWKVSDWSKCSERCDGGTRTREVMCLDMVTKHMVFHDLCDPYKKPETVESCNLEPCLEWIVSEWSICSKTCGEGKMTREVHCPKLNMCNPQSKPVDTASCFLKACVDWIEGPWSQCSVTCGGGVQIRHIKCVNLTTQGPTSGCDLDRKPRHRQPCNTDECPVNNSAFSQCHDKIESSMCKSLRHMCTTRYFKVKCCSTCGKHDSRASRRNSNRGS